MFTQDFNTPEYHQALNMLNKASQRGLISVETAKLFTDGKLNLKDRTFALRTKIGIAAGGTIDLFDLVGSQLIKGINEFNGNKLANNINFILSKIQLNFAEGVVATIGTKYDLANYTTALPPALKAANLIIEQNSAVIRRISIADINEAKSTDTRWLKLEGQAFIKADDTLAFKIEFGANAAFTNTGSNDAVYVELLTKGFTTDTVN